MANGIISASSGMEDKIQGTPVTTRMEIKSNIKDALQAQELEATFCSLEEAEEQKR